MSASDRWTIPLAVQTARVVVACCDLGEFQRDLLPRYRTEGVFVATRYTPRVGDRISIRVELLDNSIGYAGEAVVAALDQEGSCPGIRVLLNAPAPGAQTFTPTVVTQPEIETIRVSMADQEIETEIEPVAIDPSADPDSPPGDEQMMEVEPEVEIEMEIEPVAIDPSTEMISPLGGEQTMRRQPYLAEWFEVLAAGALRTGDLETAEAHCRFGIRVDPECDSLRTLLREIKALLVAKTALNRESLTIPVEAGTLPALHAPALHDPGHRAPLRVSLTA